MLGELAQHGFLPGVVGGILDGHGLDDTAFARPDSRSIAALWIPWLLVMTPNA